MSKGAEPGWQSGCRYGRLTRADHHPGLSDETDVMALWFRIAGSGCTHFRRPLTLSFSAWPPPLMGAARRCLASDAALDMELTQRAGPGSAGQQARY